MLRRVQGSLKATVLKDGSVGDVRVSRRFDREMDRVAIATVKQWRFTPASKDGRPVDAIVEKRCRLRSGDAHQKRHSNPRIGKIPCCSVCSCVFVRRFHTYRDKL